MTIRIGIGSNKNIIDLFNSMKSGDLILRPAFQRKLVWNNRHKEAFIETILMGLPFPEIYLAYGDIDLVTQRAKTLVVDGQQRLNTIYEYITASSNFQNLNIKPFKSLSPKEQTDFYDYQVVVRDLGRIDNEQLVKIFQRINSVQYALNAMEINNALYEGEFIDCAKDILNKLPFKDIDIFSETEYTRMRDLEFILLLMTTIEDNGYFSSISKIEDYIKRYDSEYPSKSIMADDIMNGFDLIVKAKLQPDSIWLRKTSFFNLIIELVFFKRKYGFYPKEKDLSLKLLKLESEIIKYKNEDNKDNTFAKYYYYTFSNTASRIARFSRGEFIKSYLEQLK